MIVAAIWLSARPLTRYEIKDALATEFQIELDEAMLRVHLDALRSENMVVSTSDGERVTVGQDCLKTFQVDLDNSQAEAGQAKDQFTILMSTYCPDLDVSELWEKFNNDLLLPMVREIGANTYRLATGEASIHDSDHLDAFLDRYSEANRDGLRRALAEFFSPKNRFTRAYILKHLNVCFFLEAVRIPNETLAAIEKSQKKRPRIRLFLDTNFLFSVLGLHENPADSAAVTLLNLSDALKNRVDLKLYVIPDTIEEVKRVIAAKAHGLASMGVPNNVASAALHTTISGIAAKYMDVSSRSERRISPADYFQPYLEDLVRILKGKGIEVFGREISHLHTRQDVVDDVMAQIDREKTKPEHRQKTYEALQHDMTLWHVVQDSRPTALESPLEAGDWVVTLDYWFLGFDQYKQRVSGCNVPTCLHPTSFIQLLQFWVPMSDEVQENILNSMRLPLIFHTFDASDEAVTLRIVQAISRYEEADDLPEETIRSILIDKALRAKLTDNVPETEQIELVREALIAEHNKAMRELVQAQEYVERLRATAESKEKKVNELSDEIQERERQIANLEDAKRIQKARVDTLESKLEIEARAREEVFGRLAELETRVRLDAALGRFKKQALYAPLGIFFLVGWAIYAKLFSGNSAIRWQVITVYTTLHVIGWLFWGTRLGKSVEGVAAQPWFDKLTHFSRVIYGFLALIVAAVVGQIVTEYWADILGWLAGCSAG